jgi:uncharacterized protein
MDYLVDEAASELTLILAHGAGAPMDSTFMNDVAAAVAARGTRVVRFEFPYMAGRREGVRRGPDRPPVLLECWRRVVSDHGDPKRLVIGGKSMGGRIASMVADELGVAGLVALGYPFHPPGKPLATRTAHLAELRTPALIVQGERDEFGNRDDVQGYELSPVIELAWMRDGDHSFKARKKLGASTAENFEECVTRVDAFLRTISSRRAE